MLIDKGAIVQIGKNIHVTDAEIVDARNMLVMPGFIDTHRHTWSTILRGMIPDGDFPIYMKVIDEEMGQHYRVEDVYAGDLLGGVSAINDGITTILDWSHIMNTPDHADGAIRGLKDSGVRSVFSPGIPITPMKLNTPDYVADIQKKYFASSNPMMTLGISARSADAKTFDGCVADMAMARKLGLRITMHVGVTTAKIRGITKLNDQKLLGPDITYVHPTGISDDEFKMISATNGTLSSAPVAEMLSQGTLSRCAEMAELRAAAVAQQRQRDAYPFRYVHAAPRAHDGGSRSGDRARRSARPQGQSAAAARGDFLRDARWRACDRPR